MLDGEQLPFSFRGEREGYTEQHGHEQLRARQAVMVGAGSRQVACVFAIVARSFRVRPGALIARSGRASNLTTAPNVFVSGGLQPWKARYDSRCLTWEAPGSEVLSLTSALLTHLTSRLKPVVLQNV